MVKGQKVLIHFPADEWSKKHIVQDEIKSVNLQFIHLKRYERLEIRKKTLRNENTKEYNEKIRIEVIE